jgi:hypothetical protein
MVNDDQNGLKKITNDRKHSETVMKLSGMVRNGHERPCKRLGTPRNV